jgi:glycosyltransferase involved in cell wall biosynthesis
MRILFATSNAFIPEHFSGQNRTLQELAAKLAELGHEPIILAGGNRDRGQPAVTGERTYGFRLLRARNPVKALAAVCVTLRPDIIVVFDGHYEALLAECRSIEIPAAVWLFHVEPHSLGCAELDEELLYMASSQFLATRAANLFGIDVRIVPPFIDRSKYQQGRRGNRVLFVNPVREKGVEIAFALAARRPTVPFAFVESWGLSEQWRRSCFERALHCGNIEWIPRSADMAAVFDRTRLLLVPRYSEEGYCRLVTEAQLGGIPALTSDRGSLAETVGPGGCVLDVDAEIDAWLAQLDRHVGDDRQHGLASEQARLHADRPEIAGPAVIEHMLELLAARLPRRSPYRSSARNP